MIESADEILDGTKGGVGGRGERDLASRTFFSAKFKHYIYSEAEDNSHSSA